MFRNFLALLCTLSMALALGGCIEDTTSAQTSSAAQSKAILKTEANTLANISLRAQSAIVSDASWFSSLTSAQELDLAALGISGTMAGKVKSAICPVGSEKVVQITWLGKSEGLGEPTGGDLAAELRSFVSADNIGTYASSGITTAAGKTIDTGTNCTGLAVSGGTPVIVFEIDKPAKPTQTVYKTEMRSVACTGTDKGTMVQKRQVSYTPEGTIEYGAWQTEDVGKCVTDVTISADVTRIKDGATINVANLGEQGAQAAPIADALAKNLKMDCAKASIDTGAKAEGDTSRQKNKTSGTIDTCTKITLKNTISAEFEETGKTEQLAEIACKGGSGSARDTVGFFNGTAVFGPWSGKAVMKKVSQNLSDGDTASQKGGIWKPVSLSCTRKHSFTINCDLPVSNSCGYTADAGNKSLVYEKIFSVNGFRDIENLIPNTPVARSNWVAASGSCKWTKAETVIPICGANQIGINGERMQDMQINAFDSDGYQRKVPVITKAAQCLTPACEANFFELTAADGVKKCAPRQCHMFWSDGSRNYSTLFNISDGGGVPVANQITTSRRKNLVGVDDYGVAPCSNYGLGVGSKDTPNAPLSVATLQDALVNQSTTPAALAFSSPMSCQSSNCPAGMSEYEFANGARKCVRSQCQIYWDRGKKRNLIYRIEIRPDSTGALMTRRIQEATGKSVGHTFGLPDCGLFGIPFGAKDWPYAVDMRQFPDPVYD